MALYKIIQYIRYTLMLIPMMESLTMKKTAPMNMTHSLATPALQTVEVSQRM